MNKIVYPPKTQEELESLLRELSNRKVEKEKPKSELLIYFRLGLWLFSGIVCLTFFLFGLLDLIQSPKDISSAGVFVVIPAVLITTAIIQLFVEENFR